MKRKENNSGNSTFQGKHFSDCDLLLLSGCSIFSRSQSGEKAIVDPLIERNKAWREQVEAGNLAIQDGDLTGALEAYQAALAIKPNTDQVQFQIAKLYFQQEEYEKARTPCCHSNT